ncbi:hypothetical protein GCM10010151_67850 [Actinoallomurus spadix]|uniref:Uncharacterized protein n=1 Tax=Actinoallomurus spadix TaxID=79912 RepID=A0ABN0XMX2_9ACTN
MCSLNLTPGARSGRLTATQNVSVQQVIGPSGDARTPGPLRRTPGGSGGRRPDSPVGAARSPVDQAAWPPSIATAVPVT